MTTYQNRCIFGMHGISNELLAPEVQKVQNALSNSVFSGITPSPAEVLSVLSSFVSVQEQCSLRNFQSLPVRDHLRVVVLDMMLAQLDGVNNLAKGNVDILSVSGFRLRKRPTPAALPAKGVIIYIKPGANRGEFVVKYQGARNSKFFLIEAVEENGTVHTFSTTKTEFTISQFAEGSKLAISMRISNAKGFGPWSDSVNYVVPLSDSLHKPTQPGNDANLKVA